MKKKFKEILQYYGIEVATECDFTDILYVLHAVEEMFEYAAMETKETEPYATNTINDYEVAARAARNLAYEIEKE